MKNTAVLLISCPDAKGIVASVADFLYTHNANILHADEHKDFEENLFFLRIEWDLNGFALPLEKFSQYFSPLAQKFNMTWKLIDSRIKPKIALFVSKEEHCLADLLYRYKAGELSSEISLIVSNHPDAKSLADFYHIPFYEISIDIENKQMAEKKMLDLLKEQDISLIILARFMQILSPQFITTFAQPIINIHHSFLPAFVGVKPYHQAYARGVKIIGATAHMVTSELDGGPIIEQDVLRVSHRDSVSDLVQKGKDLEKLVLARAVKWYLDNRVLIYANKTVIFD